METLTGAAAILQVAHTGIDGRLHGHTYEVIGWWAGEPCAVEMQGRLIAWLSDFDHQVLPPDMSRAENIAKQCLTALDCVVVEVNRPLERLFCKVSK